MIKKLTIEDIDDILKIENEAFLHPYNKEQFAYELEDNPCAMIYGYYEEDKLIGVIDFWITFDCCQLCKIAIDKAYRRKGIATKLMNFMYEKSKKEQCENVLLEVRMSNKSAIAFYKKEGFISLNTRDKYYDNPVEDALVMGKVIVGE